MNDPASVQLPLTQAIHPEVNWGGANKLRCMLLYLSQPILLGCWLVRIPDVKDALELSNTELAIGLLGMPVGTLSMLPFAGNLLAKIGARAGLLYGIPLQIIAICLIGLADSLPLFVLIMFLGGLTLSVSEIGLGLTASYYERYTGEKLMSRAHGCWSLGAMLGSGLGVLLTSYAVSLAHSLLLVAVVSAIPCCILAHALPREDLANATTAEQAKSSFLRPPKLLVMLALFSIPLMLTEGATADWSTIYLRDLLAENSSAAGLGFVFFSGLHAAGRFSGDWLSARLGAMVLARITGTICILGVILVVAYPLPWLIICGFALMGIGASVGYPLAMSAVGKIPGQTSSHLAFLTFISFSGFLIGPPLIGFIADLFSLRFGFAILLPLLVLSLALTAALRQN